MVQQVRRRSQNSVNYASNGKVTEDLQRGMIYRELALTLSYQPTLTAANNTAANTKAGDEWAIVKRIEIIANGTETIKSFSGATLRMLNYMWFGRTPRPSTALGGTANPVLRSTLILPFWMPNSIRPIDSALDSRKLSSLTVNITWGTHTDLNANATGMTSAPVLEIDSLESFGINGPFSQWRLWEIEREITSNNSKFQIQLPVGAMYNKFYMVGTDAGVEEADIIGRVKIVSGTTVFADGPFQAIRDQSNLRNRRLDAPNNVGAANSVLGWAELEQVTDGFNTESIDTLGLSELVAEFDVTVGSGTTKLRIIPSQIVPVRKAV